ncbi:hypothetical protein [Streptomyces sp. NBC_00401]|uniref:hypothetical protein n=1 Tax=unclassified Streptomyces TaxID=2593676 RepID=UPI0022591F85|nr:hypothetical protein [Streptomyces sp. NBC_00401]MCX5083871.1 hypothetical protein [Streptomyces sp. NBC_00401]
MTDEETEATTGTKWKSLLENLNFVIALIGLVIALVAFWIPIRMDRQAQERERSRTCVEAVIDLRASLKTIEAGYATDPDQRSDRTADWNAGKVEVERTQVSCLDAPLSSANSIEESDALWEQYDTERNTAQKGIPPLDVIRALGTWTLAVISDLTRR